MWCGLWVPATSRPCPTGDALAQEEELCSIFVKLLLAMVAARTVRAIYLCRGWPSRAYRFLGSPGSASDTRDALRTDYNEFLQLERQAHGGNIHAQKLRKRSVFQLLSVQQLVEALKRSPKGEWQLYDGLIDFMRQKSQRQVNSHLNECSFNLMKNSATIKSKRRYMAPHKGTAVLIDRQVLR